MRILPVIFLITIIHSTLFSQINAVTENGEQVILNNDGTWKYTNIPKETQETNVVIPTNPAIFSKKATNSFLLKSTRTKIGVWLDSKKWKFNKATNNESAEYELQYKDGDLYAMLITEKIEIPLESLKTIALENAISVAPDAKVVKEEYRMVNGNKVLMLQMNGTTQGIKFSYYGYYYSNENGTVQFVTYTSQNLINQYKSICEDILNGLVIIK